MTRRSALALGLCSLARGQQPGSPGGPVFEVATVRRNHSAPPPPASFNGPPPPPPPPVLQPAPAGLTIENATLQYCLAWAYGVRNSLVTGPAWIKDNYYDIHAKAAGPVAADQLKAMLQALLTTRFQLVVRHEAKETSVLALVKMTGGAKLTPARPGAESSRNITRGSQGSLRLTARNTTVEFLTQLLQLPIWPPIVDQTGLTGGFDFIFDRPAREGGDPEIWLSDLTAELQSQLGLRLAKAKALMDSVAVDRGNPDPIEN